MSEQSVGDRKVMPENEPLQFALDFVQQAGDIVMRELASDLEVEWKADNTPVTKIDKQVNQLGIEMLEFRFPNDYLLGEEASSSKIGAGRTWVLDPVDGTQALEVGLPTFTVCLARLDKEGKPELAVVLNPSTGDLFVAEKRKPSMLNGEPLRVSEKDTLQSSYVYMSSRMPASTASVGTIFDRLTDAGAKVFNTRSVAYGCLMVATGKCVGSFSGVKTPFEIASVKLMVENAGGKVTDLEGNSDFRCDGEINGFVVSNGRVHEELLAMLKVEQ